MSVYVDALMDHGWVLRGRPTRSCHMIADSESELHLMAQTIGMRREWFQPKSFPHYDLTPSRRRKAVYCGAIELGRADFVGKIRALRDT